MILTPLSTNFMAGSAQATRRNAALGLRRRVLLSVLVASCCTGVVGSAFAQSDSAGASGAQTGAQSSGPAMPGESAAPTPAYGSQSMLYPGEDFQLSPGDLIQVRVFLQSDYLATVRLDQSGNAQLPFIGSVNISGLKVREAQARIADRLHAGGFYQNPEVIIQVLDTVNGSIVITGEVHAIVPVSTQRSLREVLLVAGGLPATASHTIKIVRPGLPDPIVVNLGNDLASSTAANVPVHPHDIIQITRASVVYVLGAFAHQGAYPLDQASPLTLLQLAALSGGIGFEGQFDDLRLIRTEGTDRKVVQVDVKKVREGKATDPILQANDIVFLPTNEMKATLKTMGASGVVALATLLIAIHP